MSEEVYPQAFLEYSVQLCLCKHCLGNEVEVPLHAVSISKWIMKPSNRVSDDAGA